jgi:hypothetical protein
MVDRSSDNSVAKPELHMKKVKEQSGRYRIGCQLAHSTEFFAKSAISPSFREFGGKKIGTVGELVASGDATVEPLLME